MVYPKTQPSNQDTRTSNLLKLVYDCGPLASCPFDTFDDVRSRLEREWNARPRQHDGVSLELRVKLKRIASFNRDPARYAGLDVACD
jgi:hypothetical protein